MGEAVDSWNAYKAAQQYQRSQNREAAPAKLTAAGIDFKVFNNGAHLRINVKGDCVAIDFWPGTERWKIIGDRKRQHGIDSLIAFCNKVSVMTEPEYRLERAYDDKSELRRDIKTLCDWILIVNSGVEPANERTVKVMDVVNKYRGVSNNAK